MRRLTAAATAAIAVLLMSACTPGSSTPSVVGTTPPPGDTHESSPASPIAYGLSVPDGASQIGPLIRFRSERLVDAYKPELEAIEAERAAEEEPDEVTEPTPTTAPTPNLRPEPDAFDALDDPPRPDSFVSLMRIEAEPTLVVRRVLAQLSVLLPQAQIVTDDLSAYCRARDRRITGCALDVTSTTPGGRDLHVQLSVDPGRLATRTGNAASLERPVMRLAVTYVGDPRDGQHHRDPESLDDPPDVESTVERTDWIWPKMDEDAPITEPVIDDFTVPSSATVLLTGRRPAFVTMTTPRSSIAAEVSEAFTGPRVDVTELRRDVIADLNEVIVTTWGPTADGGSVRTVHTLTARGNYLSLHLSPPA